jgi:hypothetical protein
MASAGALITSIAMLRGITLPAKNNEGSAGDVRCGKMMAMNLKGLSSFRVATPSNHAVWWCLRRKWALKIRYRGYNQEPKRFDV